MANSDKSMVAYSEIIGSMTDSVGRAVPLVRRALPDAIVLRPFGAGCVKALKGNVINLRNMAAIDIV